MKKYPFYLFVCLFSFTTIWTPQLFGQCPPPGTLVFTTQAQVDNFAATYPGCTVVPAGVDLSIAGNSITNLVL